MVAVGQQQAIRQRVHLAVPEPHAARRQSARFQNGRVRQHAQRQHRPQIRHGSELGCQEPVAGGNLFRLRQIRRRHAADGVGDAAIHQRQAIGRIGAVMARRQAEFQQRLVEQNAGEITGKRPPGAIGAAHARRHAHDQQRRVQPAEARHRGIEPARVLGLVGCPVGGQPGAQPAIGGRRIWRRQGVRLSPHSVPLRHGCSGAVSTRPSAPTRPTARGRGSICRRVNSGAMSESSRN